MRILVVEDEALVALEMEFILEANHEVVGIADTKRAALAVVEHEKPELALVDIRLAEGDSGLEVADELARRGVPTVFVTGNCPGLGNDVALACLHKPFTQAQLLNAVATATDILAGQQPADNVSGMHFYR